MRAFLAEFGNPNRVSRACPTAAGASFCARTQPTEATMATLKITRLNKNGLGGKKLQDWGNFAEGRQLVGKPRESGYNFYTDGTKQLISGVWECTAGVVAIKNFPSDEFCILLSGSVIITDAAGKAETFGPGDAFM